MVNNMYRLNNVVYAIDETEMPNEQEILDMFCESIYLILNAAEDDDLAA